MVLTTYCKTKKVLQRENFRGFRRFLVNRESFPSKTFILLKVDVMVLLEFLCKKESKSKEAHGNKGQLPDPCGPVGQEIGKQLTAAANKEVASVLAGTSTRLEPYLKATTKQKAIVAKYAAEHGMTKVIRRFSGDFGKTLKESTIRGWKKAYLQELHKRKKSGSSMVVSELKEKKNGHPLMLGEDLDRKVRAYIQDTHRFDNAITTRVVMAGALGIVKEKDKNLLAENGGHIVINKSWARYLMQHMNFVKERHAAKLRLLCQI